MYKLLQGRRLMKVKELAEILEVSERMIKEYRSDMEKAGIYIGAKKGRYGGYYLENKMDLKGLKIRKEEIEALKMANEIIRSGDHIFALDFETLASKILNSEKEFDHINYFNKDNLRLPQMKEKEVLMWNKISKAEISKKKIKILYKSLSSAKEKERIIHPYGTFDHEGASYFFGYCESRSAVRQFKISRIENLEITQDKFIVNVKYDIKDIMRKSFGIIDDDIFYLKLKISYPMSQLIKERLYSLNQKIKDLDEDTIIYEANFKGYKEVKTWVLGMGSKVEVLEPEKLRNDIIAEIEVLKNIYQ